MAAREGWRPQGGAMAVLKALCRWRPVAQALMIALLFGSLSTFYGLISDHSRAALSLDVCHLAPGARHLSDGVSFAAHLPSVASTVGPDRILRASVGPAVSGTRIIPTVRGKLSSGSIASTGQKQCWLGLGGAVRRIALKTTVSHPMTHESCPTCFCTCHPMQSFVGTARIMAYPAAVASYPLLFDEGASTECPASRVPGLSLPPDPPPPKTLA